MDKSALKAGIVLNPNAGGGKAKKFSDEVKSLLGGLYREVECAETTHRGHAIGLTRHLVESSDVDHIWVVGGDGTMNEAINGYLNDDGQVHREGVSIGGIPAGTGGDFARTTGMRSLDWRESVRRSEAKVIDCGVVEFVDHHDRVARRFFLNIASFGSSGLVTQKVNRASKWLGGKGTYLWGTVQGMMEYENQRVKIEFDGHECVQSVNIVAVANGRYFGGSMKIAPAAMLNDSLFDLVISDDLRLKDFLKHHKKLYAGEHVALDEFQVHRVPKVTASSLGDEVMIEVDGESLGRLPATFDVGANAISFLAPWSLSEGLSS